VNYAFAIARREFVSFFRVPAGWIILALFSFLSGVLFVNQTLIPGQPGTMRYFFIASAWLLIPIAPAVSMRLLAEEYRTGSFEALRTTPAGDWSVATGKFLGALAFLGAVLAPTLALPVTLALVSDPAPDPGPVVSGYLMLVLVGSLYLAIGLLASSLTSSQTLAFLGTIMTLALMMAVTTLLAPHAGGRAARVLEALSIVARAAELGKGIVDSATVLFFLIGTLWMLALTGGVLEARRLARSRASVAFTGAVFALATGTACVFAGSLAHTHRFRIDATALGSHELSPRALRLVRRAEPTTRIVLAADLSRVDRVAADLVRDVVDAYGRASDRIETSVIDLSDPSAPERIAGLVASLRAEEPGASESGTRALGEAASAMREAALALESLAPGLRRAASLIGDDAPGAVTNRAFFEQRAALVRVHARDLDAAGDELETALAHRDAYPGEAASGPEQLCGVVASQLEDLSSQLDRLIAARGFGAALVTRCRSIRDALSPTIASLARTHAQLGRIEPTRAQRVGEALRQRGALLVVGPPGRGIAAVELSTLMPPTRVLVESGISPSGVIAPRAQELVASALAQTTVREHPVLVLTHAGSQGYALANPELFRRTGDLLARRSIETIEWSVLEHDEPPTLRDIDPIGTRPVVYLILGADSAAASSQGAPSGTRRAEALGAALTRLLERGESVLVSVSPSIFRSFGSPDPIAEALDPIGVIPDPSITLLGETRGPRGTRADPVTTIVRARAPRSHPLASTLVGIRGVIPWGVPLSLDERVGVEHWPLLEADGGDALWGERDWIGYWTAPGDARPYLEDQPKFDPARDERRDRWLLAAAAQRDASGRTQRVVVVGSNAWMTDAIVAAPERVIDGRVTRPYPMNRVLLESSIAWLARLDDLVAPGVEARPVATIGALDASTLGLIRWVLLGAIPLGILGAGAATRLVFG